MTYTEMTPFVISCPNCGNAHQSRRALEGCVIRYMRDSNEIAAALKDQGLQVDRSAIDSYLTDTFSHVVDERHNKTLCGISIDGRELPKVDGKSLQIGSLNLDRIECEICAGSNRYSNGHSN